MAHRPPLDFTITAEHKQLRSVVRRFAEQYSGDADVRRSMASQIGYDRAVWDRMAGQIGLPGLVIPERYGGAGASFVELSIVLQEMGRRLFCAPFFATTVLATHTLCYADDDAARHEYLPGIAAGTTVATLAWVEAAGAWRPGAAYQTGAVADGPGWKLRGRKSFVLDGHVADLILVIASTVDGDALFAVTGDAPGLARSAVPTLDQTRRLATISFDDTPARLIATRSADAVLDRVLDVAAVGLAAEQVGVAEFALETAVAYAQTRIQFDRVIASFQAVKHRCAQMLVEVEAARCAAGAGAYAVAEQRPDLPVAAAVAKTVCSQSCSRVTGDSIQLHGGIGFTWEHAAQLYFKRAKSSELLFGDPSQWRELLAQRLSW
ncbi:MAG TPA: acyl-CoA dehydrogenase family protein [Micromonosporaceae bacterium]